MSLRLAVGQLRMHWTVEANLAAMLEAVELAHRRGAAICSFPELAVTGFHREIAQQARPERVVPALQALQALCERHAIAVAVGAPGFGADGARFNSHWLIDERGVAVAAIAKNGLTAPEASFFHAGTERPAGLLQGLRCSAVICREIEDEAAVCAQLPAGSVDLVFWPGQMRPDPALPPADPPAYVVQAQRLARSLGAHVIQANWPNALNRPQESEHTGHSAVIAPDGTLLFRLPRRAPGLAVFGLGERGFEWHAQP